MSNSVTIETPEGETVEIEVEELSELQKIRWAAKAPRSLRQEGPSEIDVTVDVIEYLIDLIESQTILTRSLLEELDQEQISHVFEGVAANAFDREIPSDNPSGFDNIELNEDGSVDLEEWE